MARERASLLYRLTFALVSVFVPIAADWTRQPKYLSGITPAAGNLLPIEVGLCSERSILGRLFRQALPASVITLALIRVPTCRI
jgi:hypothetical protein